MAVLRKLVRGIDRFYDWLGLAAGYIEDAAPDPLIALDPYEVKDWPSCTPRIGETFGRYRERARRSQERAHSEDVWRVTAAPDRDGVWKTAHDQITRKRDRMLDNGFAS